MNNFLATGWHNEGFYVILPMVSPKQPSWSVCHHITHTNMHINKRTSEQHSGQRQWDLSESFTLCLTVTSQREASFAGGDGVQRNKAFALLAVLWQSVGGESGVSIIITVIILTTIIIIIIPQQMGAHIQWRMEHATAAERRGSQACTSDYSLNSARLWATNWVYCPCENVTEEKTLECVSQWRSIHL